MLVMMYHMLRKDVYYEELGHDYLDKPQPQRLAPLPGQAAGIFRT